MVYITNLLLNYRYDTEGNKNIPVKFLSNYL